MFKDLSLFFFYLVVIWFSPVDYEVNSMILLSFFLFFDNIIFYKRVIGNTLIKYNVPVTLNFIFDRVLYSVNIY